MICTLLVDDHAIVRAGFRALIERETDMAIVGECASVAEAERALSDVPVDVLVLDITMRGGSGLAALPKLRAGRAGLRLLVLSMHEGAAYVADALARGADGYVTKAAGPEELIAGIRAVAAGQRFLSSDIAARPRADARASIGSLSSREREVLLALAGGATPKQAAAALGISVKTVYVQRANVLAKLGVRGDRDLYRIAREHGLVEA
jgi:two-component system uhpT operon response regulator UhpA